MVRRRLGTVADGARCALASQQRVVVGSILRAFEDEVVRQAAPGAVSVGIYLVAPLLDIGPNGVELDLSVIRRQPDWATDASDSGRTPAERLTPLATN